MLHAYVQRFDVISTVGKKLETKQTLSQLYSLRRKINAILGPKT